MQAAILYADSVGKAGPICDSPQMSLAQPTRPVWPQTKYFTPASTKMYVDNKVAVLGWEVLAKGFMAGKWQRADGERSRETLKRVEAEPAFAASLQPTGERAAEWRELQLTTAYCTEENFKRRERAEELASKKSLSLAQADPPPWQRLRSQLPWQHHPLPIIVSLAANVARRLLSIREPSAKVHFPTIALDVLP